MAPLSICRSPHRSCQPGSFRRYRPRWLFPRPTVHVAAEMIGHRRSSTPVRLHGVGNKVFLRSPSEKSAWGSSFLGIVGSLQANSVRSGGVDHRQDAGLGLFRQRRPALNDEGQIGIKRAIFCSASLRKCCFLRGFCGWFEPTYAHSGHFCDFASCRKLLKNRGFSCAAESNCESRQPETAGCCSIFCSAPSVTRLKRSSATCKSCLSTTA